MRHDISLLTGALFGLTAIALGAFVEHGLRPGLSAHDIDNLAIALRYQLVHAVLLVALGLFGPAQRWLSYASGCFVAGVLCFSGGIEVAFIGGVPAALRLAPVGGSLLMLGWLLLAVAGVTRPRR